MKKARDQQTMSLALSRETADNSFGLTANVRSYIASGETRFKDAYFAIIDIWEGKVPRPETAAVAPGRTVHLDTLYDEAGFTPREKELLGGLTLSLGDSSDSVRTFADQISASAESLAQGTTTQAASLESTSTSEQVTAARELSEQSGALNSMVGDLVRMVDSGRSGRTGSRVKNRLPSGGKERRLPGYAE